MDTNMYFYISKLLRDSNFLFQILPTFIDYNSAEEVKDMFRPISLVSDGHSKKGPVYTCIYIGSSSQYLDIGDGNEYYYSNDGYSLNDKGKRKETSGNVVSSVVFPNKFKKWPCNWKKLF